MIKINTEIAVTIILTLSVMVAIFTVVGFSKTAKDLESIDESVKKTQSILQEQNKTINKLNADKGAVK